MNYGLVLYQKCCLSIKYNTLFRLNHSNKTMRSLISAVFIICGIKLIFLIRVNAYSCKRQLSNCSCVTDVDGWILNLSPLDSETNGGLPFSVVKYGSNYT